MTTLKESAMRYEPKQTKNVAELDIIPINYPIFEGNGTKKDGKPFTYHFMEFNGEEYRVPDSVRKALKEIIKSKPDVTEIAVSKTGEGINSIYTTIPL